MKNEYSYGDVLREWLKRLAPALENATKIQETKRP